MLEHTFLHLAGVGHSVERSFWENGIFTWQDALSSCHLSVGQCYLGDLRPEIDQSLTRLAAGDARYFHLRLPAYERWRLFNDFADRAVCLDIETTGLFIGESPITMIGLYDGREYKAFVRGQNLEQFPDEIRRYGLVVTYNGCRFDIPFIQAEMGPVLEDLAHLDIMYPLRRLGYRGGLKVIEQRTHLARPSALDGLSGYDAVVMWRLYQQGHRGALESLIRYNAEDVADLLPLAILAYNRLVLELPVNVTPMPMPPRPLLDLPYDSDLVEWLKQGRC